MSRDGSPSAATPLRRLVGAVAIALALASAIAIPAIFLYDAYTDTLDTLGFKARLNANRLSAYIETNEQLWQHQPLRLAEQIQLPYDSGEVIHQRLYGEDGTLVLEDGPVLPEPVLTARADIVVSGSRRGYLEVSGGFTQQLITFAFVAFGGAFWGLLLYFLMRTFPMRGLDRTISVLRATERDLATQNDRLQVSERQLTNALQIARAGNWEYDVARDLFIFNDSFYRIFRTTAEEVGGYTMRSADYAKRFVHPDDIAVVGNEVKAAIESEDPNYNREFEHRMIYADGTPGYITVRFFILKDERGQTIRTHGVNQDITERKRNEVERAQSRMRLDTALSSMTQGLCKFDADEKLTIINRRFAEILGLPDEQLQPGLTLKEMVSLVFSRAGMRSPEEAEAVYERLHGETAPTGYLVQRLSDDRSIAINYGTAPDGGFVATIEDITEREGVVADLAESRSRLDVALNNMSQGLCMFDADERLVLSNPRFAEIYGLRPDQVAPGTLMKDVMAIALDRTDRSNLDLDFNELLEQQRAVAKGGIGRVVAQPLDDGRVISISQRIAPNGGLVTTFDDITEREKAEAEIKHLARHDGLTDLLNRASFYEEVGRLLGQLGRAESIAILSIDLDHFKSVNDSLGHPIGDLLLKAAAGRMKAGVREEDFVARLGGDEFAIVLVLPEDPPDVAAFSTRLIETLTAPYELSGHQVVIGASVGIALAPADGTDPDTLMKNADLALYRAKAEGGSLYSFFEPEMDARMQQRRQLELDLRNAVVNGEFELHYQPVIDLKSNSVTSCEALIRWNHPERDQVPPDEFVAVAEETGLIVPMGEWILRQACMDAVTWPPQITVAVNLSPAQFKSKHLVQAVRDALASSGLPASRLELEITELVLLEDNEGTLSILHELRDLGIRIAMDDFGTGYSSLGYLRSFPFDKIKIDQTFIQDLPHKEESLAIVRAVVGLGSSLGITTTAEGVETEEQLRSVASEGCTEFQGYIFSKPQPAHEVRKLLEAEPAVNPNA